MFELTDYELRNVTSPADRLTYHRIRRTVLFEARGRFGIYDQDHPDEHRENNYPLLLMFCGNSVGTARLDCPPGQAGIIRLLAIDQAHQGRGHGRAMVSLIVEMGRNLGLPAL